ncbi:MAG TPA: hypothetical protein VGH54_09510 [Mycobacterium sp.]|jgi:hypothetical protein|uniref:phage tail tube protein n=1 Tax=Mycobacterium sp. TaxID=1785 RepID=UPI002F41EBAC
MAVTIPPGVKAEGNLKVAYCPTLTSVTAPPVADLTATGCLDISFFLTEGNFKPNSNQNRGDDRRVGSKQTFQTLGRENPAIDDIVYIVDPQAATAAVTNKAYELFQSGVGGFLVVRYGLDAETIDFVAAQKVDIWPIVFGIQGKTPLAGNDEFAKITVTQPVAVTGVVQRNIAVVS